jgi:hypothetical protein
MELIKGQTVIVLDTSNYKAEYVGEIEEPFRATVEATYDNCVVVTREDDLKKFELYDYQILECMTDGEIKSLIDIDKYGYYNES